MSSTDTDTDNPDFNWEMCTDCHAVTDGDGFVYDDLDGSHYVCEACGEKRGFRVNQAYH